MASSKSTGLGRQESVALRTTVRQGCHGEEEIGRLKILSSGCGHAPALNTPEQYALVERFLAA
jgi:hypothetical protein